MIYQKIDKLMSALLFSHQKIKQVIATSIKIILIKKNYKKNNRKVEGDSLFSH